MRTFVASFGFMLLMLSSRAVIADDARIQIDQACALTGCFPGDPPGLPVVITSEGSYVLGTSLTTTDTDAIHINVPNVTLDLNGFSLVGNASPSSDGIEIGVPVSPILRLAVVGVEIRDGIIRGFGGSGVRGSSSNIGIRRVRFLSNDLGVSFVEGTITESLFLGNRLGARVNSENPNNNFPSGAIRDSEFKSNTERGQEGGYCDNNFYVANGSSNVQRCVSIRPSACTGAFQIPRACP